ncbi:hypothetical protein C6401_15310 [Arthrobacter woluwensis]|uniref:hypothetical protein n=1 Tax=Arthrobacter woluwensis TaxID=156980 RepID=UPI000D13AFBB|nr:hypothetical protein [Arthrobacter woluwensis]PSS42923.1 hypothetical protein C6401_15310 [Arthrobacter woluwensis]
MTALDLDRIEALADNASEDGWWTADMLESGVRVHRFDAELIAETGPDVVKELIRQLREALRAIADLRDELGATQDHSKKLAHFRDDLPFELADAWDEGFNEGHRAARSLTHRDNPYRRTA